MSDDDGTSEESEYEEEFIEEADETDLMELEQPPSPRAQEPRKRFQKEQWINAHLPYASELEAEADHQFSVIKSGIGHSLALREIRPSLLHWACELDKFISLHGRRFSKSEHVALVEVFYDVVLIPGLEFRMVKTFAHVVCILLEKREMLSPEDLQLDWRPLYDLYALVTFKNMEEDGTFLLPENISQSLEVCISRCRPYFKPGATAEILALQRPYLCPWDVSMHRAVSCLAMLLPTTLSPAVHASEGASLWFPEAVHWYSVIQNCPPWEPKFFQLFARVAKDSPGAVDFRPHYPLIFGRLLRSFGLHLGSGLSSGGRVLVGSGSKHFDWDSATLWLAYQFGGEEHEVVEDEIRSLFQAVESYYHPSNTGKHTERLLNFLFRLARQLCLRLHRERHRAGDWTPGVPKAKQLTDAQVESFVKIVLPCAMAGMFSKVSQNVSSAVIRHLALLAPRLVVPAVLDKLFGALESLTEPHRLLNSLSALNACLVPLVRDGSPWDLSQRGESQASLQPPALLNLTRTASKQGKRKSKGQEEAKPSLRVHVIPLLNSLLPALDPNDITKAMLAFQALSLLMALVPMVDVSEGAEEVEGLTAEEKELASASASLDSFVSLLLDRLFALLENLATSIGTSLKGDKGTTGVSSGALSLEENYIKMGLSGVFRTVLANSATPIYRLVVGRLSDFLRGTVYDSSVAADTLSEMIYAAVRIDPEYSLPIFIPMLQKGLEDHITEDISEDDEVDSTVLWYLTLLKGLVRTDGSRLLQHQEALLPMLRLGLGLRCKRAYEMAHQVLEFLLGSLCGTYLLNHEAKRRLLDSQPKDHFVIRHWGAPTRRKDFRVRWHVPSAGEVELAQRLLDEFLAASLTKLDSPSSLSKEEVLARLGLCVACLCGAGALLPHLDSPLVSLTPDAAVDPHPFTYVTRPATVTELQLSESGNVRMRVLKTLRSLLDFLLKKREDDTKSLTSITKLYHCLIFHFGLYKWKYDKQVKTFNYSKKAVGDIVRGKKAVLESVFAEFALIAHHKRLLEQRGAYQFTESHKEILADLLRISTSAYSAVRREGQSVLQMCTNMFPYCYKWLLRPLEGMLKDDPDVSHEQFKGALYVVGGGKSKALVVRQNWPTLRRLWPALIQAQHSEKPSIIAMLDELQNTVVDNLESFQITLEVPSSLVQRGLSLWSPDASWDAPSWPKPSDAQVAAGVESLAERNAENSRLYEEVISELVRLAEDPALHWRHADMAQSLLSLMVRRDRVFPATAVATMTKLLVHDSLKTRKMTISYITAWLKITKARPKKVPYKFPQGVTPVRGDTSKAWGYRPDNAALLWRESEVPRSEAAWNSTQFVEQTHWGFACWPEDMKVYAPPPEQAKWNRTRDELSPNEVPVFDAVTDDAFMDKLLAYLAIEEKKGDDQFQSMNFSLFKGLVKNFGSAVVERLQPPLRRLLASEREGEQRLGAEIVAGIVQGTKLWPYLALEELWAWLGPLLEETWLKLNSESNRNWGTCVATALNSRDPRRLRWLIETTRNLAKRPVESSFHLSNRFYVFQGALNQMEWRVPELWRELLDMLRPIMAQPYQNVRSRIGSCLATIVWFDIPGLSVNASGSDRDRIVRVDEVIEDFKATVPTLLAEITSNRNEEKKSREPSPMDTGEKEESAVAVKNGFVDTKDDPKRKSEILRLKTLLCYLNSHWPHGYVSITPGILSLLPLLVYFENEAADEELKRDTLYQRLYLAKAELRSVDMPTALGVAEGVAALPWWKSKLSLLRYLQISVFSNLFVWKPAREGVEAIVRKLLADQRLEVREAAGETLSGFFHCGFIPLHEAPLKDFAAQAKASSGLARHAGVLGLAAAVAACPYSVPSFLPTTLMALSAHAADPEPIRGTVRKCLAEFKRTHHDSWTEHKAEFSEDQLTVLTDLLVSPSYYV